MMFQNVCTHRNKPPHIQQIWASVRATAPGTVSINKELLQRLLHSGSLVARSVEVTLDGMPVQLCSGLVIRRRARKPCCQSFLVIIIISDVCSCCVFSFISWGSVFNSCHEDNMLLLLSPWKKQTDSCHCVPNARGYDTLAQIKTRNQLSVFR